ncbi:MAG: glycosyltransferase [Schleiferiaceae bacterium]|nr:glycosyltransferase [Schleiferiaceae bacterium]
MHKSFPLVSVIAICYNHEKFLIECLDSIANQTYPNIELLIIDSNSTDNSVQQIENWLHKNDFKATFIQHKTNHKLTQNLNIGLRSIKGKYFQGLSCDDAMTPDKIAEQVAALEAAAEDVALSYSGIYKVDEAGSVLEKELYCRPLQSANHRENIVFGSIFYSSAALLRTSAVRAVGGYDESLYYEDWDLALRLLKAYTFLEVPKFLSRYRVHSNSMTEVYNLDKCLSVVRLAMREYRQHPHSAFLSRATAFSKRIVIAEKLFSYRLTGSIEKVWPTFTLWLVQRNYKNYFSQPSIYL